MEEKKIEEIVQDEQLSLQNKNRKLMQEALQAGGYDNITVVLVEVEEKDRLWKE